MGKYSCKRYHTPHMTKYLILGGGIAGLSAAWFLHKKHPDAKITLLEKSARLGGWMQTEQLGDFSFEKGPRTFQAGKCPHLLALIRDVGLGEELLFSDPLAAKRYLWHRGRLRSMGSLVPRLLPYLIRELFVAKRTGEEETIYQFATRRFGPFVAETLFDPMTLGIYGGDIRTLSLKSCFPFLAKAEEESGSVVRHLFKKPQSGLFTLKNGMGHLILALQQKLPIEIVFNCPIESVTSQEVVAGGTRWRADRIFCALPASMMGPLFGVPIPTRDLSVVGLFYEQTPIAKKGFGYLVPSQEREPLMGMIWDSIVFRRQQGIVTAMVRPEAKDPVAVALKAMERHLNVREKPAQTALFIAKDAIPQFEVGHAQKLALLEKRAGAVVLLGNYFEGASVEATLARSHLNVEL